MAITSFSLFFVRYMAYEFELNSTDYKKKTLKQMAEIIVPFDSIVALWFFDKGMAVNYID